MLIILVAYQLEPVLYAAARFKELPVVGDNQLWCVAAVTAYNRAAELLLSEHKTHKHRQSKPKSLRADKENVRHVQL
jgi:hypothetical protein